MRDNLSLEKVSRRKKSLTKLVSPKGTALWGSTWKVHTDTLLLYVGLDTESAQVWASYCTQTQPPTTTSWQHITGYYFMGGFYGKLVLLVWDLCGQWVVVGSVQTWCCVWDLVSCCCVCGGWKPWWCLSPVVGWCGFVEWVLCMRIRKNVSI